MHQNFFSELFYYHLLLSIFRYLSFWLFPITNVCYRGLYCTSLTQQKMLLYKVILIEQFRYFDTRIFVANLSNGTRIQSGSHIKI
jgi:hypothetical protein